MSLRKKEKRKKEKKKMLRTYMYVTFNPSINIGFVTMRRHQIRRRPACVNIRSFDCKRLIVVQVSTMRTTVLRNAL